MRSAEAEKCKATLSLGEALVSPCATCQSTPCCQYLPLQTFALTTLTEVDYALYLLNFENIELGVTSDGTWSVYYRQSCRFLDPGTFACRLHGTPDKPHVCVQYNPYTCFYRSALSSDDSPSYVRMDRRRMRLLAESLTFDADRRVVGAPTNESLIESFRAEPIAGVAAPDRAPATTPDALDESASVLGRPCDGCAAYCCTRLMFSVNPPVNLSSLDYLRFALGFPGTEVVVVDTVWHLAVQVPCRHLDGRRCGVFGSADRPLRCQFYDEWTCGYRPVFAGTGVPTTARVRLEDFPALAATCTFTPDGAAATVPTAEELRLAVKNHRLANGDARPGPPPGPANGRRLIPLVAVTNEPIATHA